MAVVAALGLVVALAGCRDQASVQPASGSGSDSEQEGGQGAGFSFLSGERVTADLSAETNTLLEPLEGEQTGVTMTVSLGSQAEDPVRVSYETVDDTATAGEDYEATSGTLTIPAGETEGTVDVPIRGDGVHGEGQEDFQFEISKPSAAGKLAGEAETLTETVTIKQVLAAAGADRTVNGGETLLLDGGASRVPGGGTATWTRTAGSVASPDNPRAAVTTAALPEGGGDALEYQLQVAAHGDTDTDILTLNPLAYEGIPTPSPAVGRHAEALTVETSPLAAMGIAVRDGYGYVALDEYDNALGVVDFSAPRGQRLVERIRPSGTTCTSYDCDAVAVGTDGNHPRVYWWDADTLRVVDVGEPGVIDDEQVRGSWSPDGFSTSDGHPDLALGPDGKYLYVTLGSKGLYVVDVQDPANPQLEASQSATYQDKGVAVDGDVAYVARDLGEENLEVTPLDISNPATPSYQSSGAVTLADVPQRIATADGQAYVTTASGLEVLDIASAPLSPNRVGQLTFADPNNSREPRSLAVAGDSVFLGERNEDGRPVVRRVDVSDPASPSLGREWAINAMDVAGVAAANGAAYWVTELPVETPGPSIAAVQYEPFGGNATPVAEHPVDRNSGDGWGMAVAGKRAYLADGGHGLDIIDLGDSADDLSPLGSYDPGLGSVREVAVRGTTAFVAANDGSSSASQVLALDVSDPSAPEELGSWSGPTDPPTAIVTSPDGSRLLVLFDGFSDDKLLYLLDSSDPGNLEVLASVGASGLGMDVDWQDGYVYVANNNDWDLDVWSLNTDQGGLTFESEQSVENPQDVVVQHGYAFLSEDAWVGPVITIFDVGGGDLGGTPSSPVQGFPQPFPRLFDRLHMAGHRLYASTAEGPVRILRFHPSQVSPFPPLPLEPVGLTAQQGDTAPRPGLAAYGDRILRGMAGGGLSVFQAAPRMERRGTATQSGSHTYEVTWSSTTTAQDWGVACSVTAGECTVESVDAENQTAQVTWDLGSASDGGLGDQAIRVGVGNGARHFTLRDRVRVQ